MYGADAVAGVVNFIMDTNFEGVKFDGTWSIYQHNNRDVDLIGGQTVNGIQDAKNFPYPTGSNSGGRSIDGTVSIGAGFDDGRGHVVGYFGYRKIKPVSGADRNYSSCSIGENRAHTANSCAGSATANPGNVLYWIPGQTSTSTIGALGPGTIARGTNNVFNFGPLNYFQRPDERYTAGVFANYDITPALKPYLEFMFMDDHTRAQIAPSGDFGNTFTINCDNPLMSAAQRTEICNSANLINGFLGNFPLATGAGYNPNPGNAPVNFFDARGNTYNAAYFQLLRRNTEGGNRVADLTHTSYRGVLGMRGDLSNVFSYDAYYQYGRTEYQQVYENEFSVSRLNNALNVVNVDPATGAVVPVGTAGSVIECRSVLAGTDTNCVPYDVFGAGGPSAAAINYLNVFGVMTGRTSEQVADINFTGDLGNMGWTPAVGDRRSQRQRRLRVPQGIARAQPGPVVPDERSRRSGCGDASGQRQLRRQRSVRRNPDPDRAALVHRRADHPRRLPQVVVQDERRPQVQHGYLQPAGRVRADPRHPVPRLRTTGPFALRTSRSCSDRRRWLSTAVPIRAPATRSRPRNMAVSLRGSRLVQERRRIRPPSTTALSAATRTCVRRSATTKTVGVVLQPRFLPRFAATVDYCNIDLKGAIQGFGADAILADCVANSTATSAAPSCDLIHRNPAGSLWLSPDGYVIDLPHNVGGDKTDGIDVTAAYSRRFGGLGNFSLSYQGTWVRNFKVDNGLTEPYDCVGLYGSTCGTPIFKYRHKAAADLGYAVRHRDLRSVASPVERYCTRATARTRRSPAGTH